MRLTSREMRRSTGSSLTLSIAIALIDMPRIHCSSSISPDYQRKTGSKESSAQMWECTTFLISG